MVIYLKLNTITHLSLTWGLLNSGSIQAIELSIKVSHFHILKETKYRLNSFWRGFYQRQNHNLSPPPHTIFWVLWKRFTPFDNSTVHIHTLYFFHPLLVSALQELECCTATYPNQRDWDASHYINPSQVVIRCTSFCVSAQTSWKICQLLHYSCQHSGPGCVATLASIKRLHHFECIIFVDADACHWKEQTVFMLKGNRPGTNVLQTPYKEWESL